MNVLLIDNYDSFTYNLAQYLGECGATVHVFRNDAITLEAIEALQPERIVLSPGPGDPGRDPGCLGVGQMVLQTLARSVPTLGVCLGHQGIGAHFGGRVVPARCLMHGKACRVEHEGSGLFAGVENPLTVGRYHSLALDPASLPEALEVTAHSEDGEVMALRHRRWPIYGVQFHPESILTAQGKRLLANFLGLSGPTEPDLPAARVEGGGG